MVPQSLLGASVKINVASVAKFSLYFMCVSVYVGLNKNTGGGVGMSHDGTGHHDRNKMKSCQSLTTHVIWVWGGGGGVRSGLFEVECKGVTKIVHHDHDV